MIYRVLSKIERVCAGLQGKGWGADTVEQEVNRLKRFIANPVLAIDIGANVGNYTEQLQKKFKGIEVHLFEPSKLNIEKLSTRFNSINVVINQVAVSNKNGAAMLYSNAPGSALASLTKRQNLEFEVFEEVETITFESYWKQILDRRDIDLVKIDVEGHELDVLEGLGEAIYKTKVIQ